MLFKVFHCFVPNHARRLCQYLPALIEPRRTVLAASTPAKNVYRIWRGNSSVAARRMVRLNSYTGRLRQRMEV